MASNNEKGIWRTINGVHVFLRDGESMEDALYRTIAKKNEDIKAEQIAKNKKKADELNGKAPQEKAPTKGKPVTYKGYGVDYDIYGKGEYSVSVDGDDVIFKSYDQAKAYIDKLTGKNDTETSNNTFAHALKNNDHLQQEIMDFSRANRKNDNNFINGSVRLSDTSYSPADRKKFEKDIKQYMQQNFPNLDYALSVRVRKDGTWLNIKNNRNSGKLI